MRMRSQSLWMFYFPFLAFLTNQCFVFCDGDNRRNVIQDNSSKQIKFSGETVLSSSLEYDDVRKNVEIHDVVRNRRSTSNLPSPPSIYPMQRTNNYYERGQYFELHCYAEGHPSPKYRWTKNDNPLLSYASDNETGRHLEDSGRMVFNNPTPADEGRYQCIAENEFGVSLSDFLFLHCGQLDPFPASPEKRHRVSMGMPFTLTCVPPKSVPMARLTWVVDYRIPDFEKLAPRVSMDSEYRLRFTNVKEEDELDNKGYACIAINSFLRRNYKAEMQYIDVTGFDRLRPAQTMYTTPSEWIGLAKEQVTMQCIFSGNPTPDHYWERVGNQTLPERARIVSQGQVLEIIDLQSEDAGMYRCWGKNSEGPVVESKVNLRVESKPYFLKEPIDVEVPVGVRAEFNCEAGGVPSPDIRWTINGLDLKDPSLKDKTFTQPSTSSLVFPNVSESDRGVIQCNVSNRHGNQFADVYLNINTDSMPRNISATNLNKTSMSVTITWEGPTSGIQIKLCDEQERCRAESVNGQITEHTIAQLKPGIYYTAKIQTVSGLESDSVKFIIPASTVSKPPSIYVQPRTHMYFMRGVTFTLPCEGKGHPPPKYRWTKNNKPFLPNGNDDEQTATQMSNSGTLVFNSPVPRDEGRYQCFAENEFGVSLSDFILLQMGKTDQFRELPKRRHRVSQGMPFTLDCVPPLSVPTSRVFWAWRDKYENKMGGFSVIDLIQEAPRISMDSEYRLRFTNIKKEDGQDNKAYFCFVSNSFIRAMVMDEMQYIEVTGFDRFRPVQIMQATPSDWFGLAKEHVRMQCIFSGNPTPDHYWERVGNQTLPERARIRSHGQVLEIIDLQSEDAGMYRCWGRNSEGPVVERRINLRVESKPYFLKEPIDVEVRVGGRAEFKCEAEGVPSPDIRWTINGLDLKDPSLKDKTFTQPSTSSLVFPNVSETDRAVIQCNVSNKHGNQFADVYLNIYNLVPRNLRATNLNRTSLSVNMAWEGPTRLMEISLCDQRARCLIEAVNGEKTEHTITNLKPGRRYTAKIQTASGLESNNVTFIVPGKQPKFHRMNSIVFKKKDRSICLGPRKLSGAYSLVQGIDDNDVTVQLITQYSKGRRSVIPESLVLAKGNTVSRVNLTAWKLPAHPGFNVSSTEVNNLVLEGSDLTITIARSHRYRAMLYSLEIVLKSNKTFHGMIELLSNLESQGKRRKQKTPKGCRKKKSTVSKFIFKKKAMFYKTRPMK